MAKIAYSRQLLWKKHQSLLVEKLQKRRRRDFQYSRKTVSVPSLSAINFADPIAVKRSAEAFKSRQVILNIYIDPIIFIILRFSTTYFHQPY